MIDTHIHMIPGVDDGAKDLNISGQMMQMAINEGVNGMILTPHFNIPRYDNKNVKEQYGLLGDYIKENEVEFELHLGNEIHLSEENVEAIKSGKVNTLAESQYLLLELPHYHFYPFHEDAIYDLYHNDDYKIILAHVERYQVFTKKPEMIREFIQDGIYAQMTSEYIVNKKTRKSALKWIEDGLIQLVASDGHDITRRPPAMKQAYEIVKKSFGESCAQTLFENNPRLIINNDALLMPKIEKVKRFSFRNN